MGVIDLFRKALRDLQRRAAQADALHPFDALHGVDTSGLMYADELATGHAHDALSEGYYATAPSLFYGILNRWQRTLGKTPLAAYTFIDLGCGKGRVLLLASEYTFAAITGIELNADLAATARENVASWLHTQRACNAIQVVTADVLSLELPNGPVVLFIFNAFGHEVVRTLMQRLSEAAQTRFAPIDILYLHPEQEELVRKTAGVQVLSDDDIAFSAEDAQADAFSVSYDRCCIYRIAGRL